MEMDKVITGLGLIVGGLILIIVFGLMLAWPMMLLWNGCLVPAITGLNHVGWVQMWGINIICGFLFKSSVQSK
jgi:hypothetical protein